MTEEASSTPPPSPAEDGPPRKRSRAVGCATVAITLVAVLCIFVIAWALHVRRSTDRFVRHVGAMLAEHEASRPAVPEGENAAPLYTAAFTLYDLTNEAGLIEGLPDPKKDYTTAQVGQYLADNKAYLAALRKAAARPKCDFELDLSKGIDLPVPHVSETRRAVRSLAVAARNAAQSGRPDEALEHLALALRLARDVGGDELLISRMVQIACEGIALHGLENVLNESEPGQGAARRFLDALTEQVRTRPNLANVLQGERHVVLAYLSRLMTGKAELHLDAIHWLGEPPEYMKVPEPLWKAAGLALMDARHYERIMGCAIIEAGKPYPGALAGLEKIDKEGLVSVPKWALATRLLLPTFSRIATNDARVLALLRAARVALGCRLYRVRFGAYPKDLKELAAKLPEHFREVPLDPFTDKPLFYQRTKTGCKVYSTGEDRTDNGGLSGSPNAFLPDVVFELDR